jgi:tRNA dimethylallyltransferase
LDLAKKLSSTFTTIDLISVDSRQLYKGMEVGTGVDVPFSQIGNIYIHGLGMLKPDEQWSVAQFQSFAQERIQKSLQNVGLPILIGGTGLYTQHIFQEDPQLFVPPNEQIRQKAAELSLIEIQNWLQKVSPEKFNSMNESDQKNPRRLVRAIEVTEFKKNKGEFPLQPNNFPWKEELQILEIGLIDTIEHIETKIRARVLKRLDDGMIEEVQKLIVDYSEELWQKMPAFSATGYKEVRAYIEEKIAKEDMIELWSRREIQYAKRQLTWFKKFAKNAKWFDISQAGWQSQAEEQIQAWLD